MLPLPIIDHADPTNFDEKIHSAPNELIVVYFWGKNCPNCDVFARYLPEMLEALRGSPLRLLKVNTYEHMSLATRFGLAGIPAFILFLNGKKTRQNEPVLRSRHLGRRHPGAPPRAPRHGIPLKSAP